MTRPGTAAGGRRAGSLTPAVVPDVVATLPGYHRAYRTASGCTVLLSREPVSAAPERIWLPRGETLVWHLSVAHKHRLPGWTEIADVRYELVPDDVTMALLLPPRDEYLNIHEFTLHLWQIENDRVAG
jgi:hypothetical protein